MTYNQARIEKRQFVERELAAALHAAVSSVQKLRLSEDGNRVQIIYESGHSKLVDIECDSFAAIILDVTRSAM